MNWSLVEEFFLALNALLNGGALVLLTRTVKQVRLLVEEAEKAAELLERHGS